MKIIKTKVNSNQRCIFLFGLCLLICINVSAQDESIQVKNEDKATRLHFLKDLKFAEENFTKVQLKVYETEFEKDAEMFSASDLLSQARAFVGDTAGAISTFEWMSKKVMARSKTFQMN